MAAGRLRWLLLLALALAEPPFPRRPLVPPRENMMPWYTAGKPSRESSGPPTEHTHEPQEATGMRLLRQRAAELSSPPPPTRSNRGRSQGLDAGICCCSSTGAIMSSQCTTHSPPSPACMCPSARNAVRLAVSCLVVRGFVASVFNRLLTPPPPSAEGGGGGGGGATKPGRTSRKHVGGGSSFQDYASPHPFPIHFDNYYLICLSSLFPSC